MKIVSALAVASAACGLAMSASAHAAPVSQIPASSEFGNAGANLLELIASDHLQPSDNPYQGRGGTGGGYGYGRWRYGEEAEGFDRRGYGYGGSAHDRRMQIIWCTQHPGRC
jgi:hypothetical protein